MNNRKGTPNSTDVYRGMDQAHLDAAYNNRAAVSNSEEWLKSFDEWSESTRSRLPCLRDVVYGQQWPEERIDVFLGSRNAGRLFVFFHGGYWQFNRKEQFSFVAEGLHKLGLSVAVVGYPLCPKASIGEIVSSCRRAISFLQASCSTWGCDPENLIVGGWSAGAQLALLAGNNRYVSSILAISGLYDLEPISLSYLNNKLKLTELDIEEMSPCRRAPPRGAVINIAVGSAELPELVNQSEEYLKVCRERGGSAQMHYLERHNHYSILTELARADGRLASLITDLGGAQNNCE